MRRTNSSRRVPILLAAAVAGLTALVVVPPRSRGDGEPQSAASKQLYTCGMHPTVVQEGPGQCPICGMNLTPINRQAAPKGGAAGRITIDPVVVQNMGVRVKRATRGALSRKVRTIGEVVVAEDLLSVVNLKFAGWIEKLYVDQTGVKVRRGQPLFRVYSPELVSAQEEYLLALGAAGADSPLARSARTKLKLYDLPDSALAEVERRGKPMRTLTIRAPRTGFVLQKNVIEGVRAQPGENLFRIGKLGKIWVQVQVYEFDAPWIKHGQPATMELPFQRGKLYEGRVSYIYPTLNERTRTLTVRLEFVNPALNLKPGMFATVRIETRQKVDALRVPTEAIIYSGERQLVFVAEGVGRYAPRELVTGLVGSDGMTEVISGLEVGQLVVVSGQFLLDSESQLREAVAKMRDRDLHSSAAASRPSTDASGETGHEHHHQHGGAGKASSESVYDPGSWTCPMHPRIVRSEQGSCPICGMDLKRQKR